MDSIDLSSIEVKQEDEYFEDDRSNDPPNNNWDNNNEQVPQFERGDRPNDNLPISSEGYEQEEEDEESKYGVDRRRKILILQFYLNEFQEKLKNYKKTDFESLSDEELDELRTEMDFVVSTQSSVKTGVDAFKQGISALEFIGTKYTPLKISGLTSILCSDKTLEDDVKSLILQNMDLRYNKPEYRIGYKICSSILLLHTVNTQKEEYEKKLAELNDKEKPKDGVPLSKQVRLEKLNKDFSDL